MGALSRALVVAAFAAVGMMILGGATGVLGTPAAQAAHACDAADTVGGGTLGTSPGVGLGWDVGSGQCNGSFTVTADGAFPGGALELGLRAEERRHGQVPRSGANDYTVLTGHDTTPTAALNRAWWNFQVSTAYGGSIADLDALTLAITTDVGPNVPTAPVVDLLPLRGTIDARNTNGTAGFADLYQISHNPEFGWFSPAVDGDANPTGAFDYDAAGAWRFTLTATEGASTSSVTICIHTPGVTCDVPVEVVLYNDDAEDGIDPADRLGAPHSVTWSDDGQTTTASASDGDTIYLQPTATLDYRLVSGNVEGSWQQTGFPGATWELEFATIHFFLTDCTSLFDNASKDPGFAYVDADNDQIYDGGLPAAPPWNLHVTGLYGPGEPGGVLEFVDGFLVAHAPPLTPVTAQIFFNGGAGGGPIPNPGFPAGLTTLNFTQGNCSADVLLDDGELTGAIGDQWAFDTAVPEGPDYTVAIPGAGLVIPASVGGLSNRFGYDYRADGTLVLDTNLEAGRAVAETQLLSRQGDVLLDDPIVRARRFVGLEALNGSVIATGGDSILADGNAGKVRIEAAFIDVSGSTLEAGRQVLLDAFTNAQGSVVAVNSVIEHTNPNGEGPTAMLPIDGGLGVGIYGYDDITVDGATIRSKDLLEIASGRNTFGAGLYALACNSGGNGHLTIGGGDNTLLPGATLGGARGVFLSAGGFAGDALDVSNSYIADTRDGAGDFNAFGIAPVLLGAFDINANGSTILGGAGAPVLFPFGGGVSTTGASIGGGFSASECVLPS